MTNPVWLWFVEQGLSGWSANLVFEGPRSKDAGPCWSFQRYGQTQTTLPDGRLIRIGGEYEDWYDPDFYIYNDVIVTDAAGQTEIFGYSEDAFPPTDFHTATLVEDRIVVIGNLSYPKNRQDKAQLLSLDTNSYRFEHMDPAGDAPPWLYKHASEYIENGIIVVRGGHMIHPRWSILVENIDDWQLDVGSRRWERLTRRAWPRFVFRRSDRKQNHLYDLGHLQREQRYRGRLDDLVDLRAKLARDLGIEPRLDLFEKLYEPDMPHERLPRDKDEFRVHRLRVDGVIVRYDEDSHDVTITVEGTLPDDIVERLRSDMLQKLLSIENAAFDCMPLLTG